MLLTQTRLYSILTGETYNGFVLVAMAPITLHWRIWSAIKLNAHSVQENDLSLGFNTLAVKHPDLVKLWAPDNIRTPEEILPTTLMRFKWLCPDCNGSYYASPKDMVSNKAECPFCTGKKPLPGFNTLAVEYPHLMDEWYFLCNTILVDPDHVLPSSTQKVWWICSNNQSHHYPMPIATRILFEKRGRESCRYCKGRRINLRHLI